MNIFLLEDDLYIGKRLEHLLSSYGEVTLATTDKEADEKLKGPNKEYDLAIFDLEINGKLTGLDHLKNGRQRKIKSFILSSVEDEGVIEKAYEIGCEHYLSKTDFEQNLDFYIEELQNNIDDSLDNFIKNTFVTKNEKLIEDIKKVLKLARYRQPLLITGPTGVGKSLLAEYIHFIANQKNNSSLVSLNCSELNPQLVESELFGHVKGSFTDARESKEGRLKLADEGTLFLDEIGTISVDLQKKLLKAIEEKSFTPVGGSKKIYSNFFLLSATCDDIFEKINQKMMRKDFYYRISTTVLQIPPLNERPEDIMPLIKHFMNSSPRRIVLSDEVKNTLIQYDWPGNIRELKSVVTKLCNIGKGRIDLKDLSIELRQGKKENDLYSKVADSYIETHGLRSYIRVIERNAVLNAMERNKGHKKNCIKELGISSSAFYRILEATNE